MHYKKAKQQESESQQEILEGIDAIGTIVEEDLGHLRQQLDELQETTGQILKSINDLELSQKLIEDNQNDIMETLKFLTDKLNHLEIKLTSGLEDLTGVGQMESYVSSEDD